MRLFAYYAIHSFKNQLRKLLKTWVVIFLAVCVLIGVVIGLGADMLENAGKENDPLPIEEMEEWEEPEVWEEWVGSEEASYPQTLGVEKNDLIELIAGAVVLAALLFEVMGAGKSGGHIFLPADVNFLFASPMRPQSVLMFRVYAQLGTGLFAGLYMLFQLPNLTLNVGLGMGAALSLVGAWCLTLLLGKLARVLLYLLCTARPGFKDNLRRMVYLLLGLAGAAYMVFWRRSGEDPFPAAVRFFNTPAARWIPVWGWIKGFVRGALEGSAAGLLLFLGLCVLGGAALVLLIRQVKADFYEEAMAKSEEIAELLERARSEKSSGLIVKRREKDRSDTLRRDGFTRGAGANVFFFKALYNRFRFAHLGLLTKTTETYLAAAVGVALLSRFVFETDSVVPAALALAALAFFRSLGNPLEEDTKMDFFRMIPESMWAKLFFSLLGGTVNCLLDVLPGVLLTAAVLRANPLSALAWVPFIVSVDFYATCVGTFIDLSVPVNAGKTVKQVVQVMFLYFGLLPDIAVLAAGLARDRGDVSAVVAALINLGLGLVFFFLSPLFLIPRSVPVQDPNAEVDLGVAKRRFSRLGLGAVALLAVTSVLQIVLGIVLTAVEGAWPERWPWLVWVVTFAPLYVAGVPLSLLVMGPVPARPREEHGLGAGRYFTAALISVFMMYAGSLAGAAVTTLLGKLFHIPVGNPVETYAMNGSLALKVLFLVILAPLFEELIFRRTLIDRMNVYGERLAVVTSAVMFGLFHGNFFQLFYAVALGLVFGYVYLKTGRLRYSVGLHMFINFLGGVLGPAMLERTDGGDTLYGAVLIGLAAAGLVLLCIQSRKVVFDPAPLELPKKHRVRTACLNPGMILLLLACLALVVLSLFF